MKNQEIESPAGAVPAALRSRRLLEAQGSLFVPADSLQSTALPIHEDGATFSMAQDARWLDKDHFAVGRWDGSLDVFLFCSDRRSGPVIRTAVSNPSSLGVQMITRVSPRSFVSSNDAGSMIEWQRTADGNWSEVKRSAFLAYDPTFGVATGGDSFTAGGRRYLVAGHSEGYLTIWSRQINSAGMALVRSVDLRSDDVVNPFGLQNIHDVFVLHDEGTDPLVVTGSENGELCLVRVSDGTVHSRMLFNPRAQRGINSIAVHNGDLLVATCSVGNTDRNLWYYRIDTQHATIKLIDSVDLKVNPHRPQAFNFCVTFGSFDAGRCWFASTEEGALWMGVADPARGLTTFGYQEVSNPLGSALAFNVLGRLIMVGFNLYEYTTLAEPVQMNDADVDADPQRLAVF